MDGAFAGICKELAKELSEENPIFDAVLIDETQDLPIDFFKIIYKLTKPPKRIIWAYDELQNIKNVAVPSAKVMFDISDKEAVYFSLDNIEDEPTKDNILSLLQKSKMVIGSCKRSKNATPNYFKELLTPQDTLQVKTFDST